MSNKKIITVFGATGAQGGGLVKAICADPNSAFTARAVTREPDSDKGKALAALGAEVVYGDLSDEASVHKALEGAYGAFFVTFFWAHFNPEQEKAEAALFAKAAKQAGIQHAIWSTLEDTRELVPISDNRMPNIHDIYKVPHFDAKGESNRHFTEAGVPTTFLYCSFYWENFIYFGLGPKRGPDGKLAITLPIGDSKMAGVGTDDIGKCAYGIFQNRDQYIGKHVGVAGEHLTGQEMADAFSKALGEPVVYNKVSADVYRGFGFPGAVELGNMFQIYDEFAAPLNTLRSVETSRQLNPALQNFEQWLSKNAAKVPLS
ncbi:MAG TPA: NmrA/HSCARG family protein [Phnomibacter sp.]|nr:NmrA/HSCARG family protein [Phnomibacter sp.]